MSPLFKQRGFVQLRGHSKRGIWNYRPPWPFMSLECYETFLKINAPPWYHLSLPYSEIDKIEIQKGFLPRLLNLGADSFRIYHRSNLPADIIHFQYYKINRLLELLKERGVLVVNYA